MYAWVMSKYGTENTYTDAELLALYRECLARISVSGQSYQMSLATGQRMFTAANLKEVRDMVTWLENRINRANDAASGNQARTYARFTRG